MRERYLRNIKARENIFKAKLRHPIAAGAFRIRFRTEYREERIDIPQKSFAHVRMTELTPMGPQRQSAVPLAQHRGAAFGVEGDVGETVGAADF